MKRRLPSGHVGLHHVNLSAVLTSVAWDLVVGDIAIIARAARRILHAHEIYAGYAAARHIAHIDRKLQAVVLAEVDALHLMTAPGGTPVLMASFYEHDSSVAMDLDAVTACGRALHDWIRHK